MSSFMQQAVAEASRRAPHWLQSLQARGLSLWEDAALPTRRSENWKYTSLAGLRDDYAPADAETEALAALPEHLEAAIEGPRVVFVDGIYQAALSDVEFSDGMEVCRFDVASDQHADIIAEHLNSSFDVEDHIFAALNTATLRDGVLVDIAKDADCTQTLHVLWLVRAASVPTAVNQRLLVRAGAGSRASIIEHFVCLDGAQPSFCNGLTELLVDENAKLEHFRIHEESGDAVHIGAVHARLSSGAHLSGFHLALGSVLKRLDIVINHAGEGAHVDLDGVYLPRGDEHIDYHTTIEHAVPHCTSDEVFRGIIADKATAVFNGRIHIHPQAQKTRAELSNRNLLTSAEATVNTKPELEIYADDVQCAHGATVAQLDATALHYLRTRGVSAEEAEVMLSFGFVNELIEGVRLASLRAYLRPLLAERFARDPDLARHLL